MITVKYSCKECGLVRREVEVPARETLDHDVVAWMKRTIAFVCEDHQKVSPHCKPETLGDLMIPIDKAEFVGQQVD